MDLTNITNLTDITNLMPLGNSADPAFKITIDTTKAGSASDTMVLPTAGATYDCAIDWGDGNTTNESGTANITHVYDTGGEYQISITGTFPRIYFNNSGDKLKLLSIDNWGTGAWSSMLKAFYYCEIAEYKATDTPNTSACTDFDTVFAHTPLMNPDVTDWDVSNVTNFNNCFSYCPTFTGVGLETWDVGSAVDMSLMFFIGSSGVGGGTGVMNADVSGWNVGNAETMNSMFYRQSSFNQDLSSWNTAKVTDMALMFVDCAAFNGSVSGWNTSLVTTMSAMFSGCSIFNQPLANFNGGSVLSFNSMFRSAVAFNQDLTNLVTSTATDLANMFRGASAFNGSISGWNTSEVTNMSYMLYQCNDFNQSVAHFDTSKVTTFKSMFAICSDFEQSLAAWNIESCTEMGGICVVCNINATGTTTNYDATLVSWAAQSVTSELDPSMGTSKYSVGAATTARAVLTDPPNNWVITDGGQA